MTNNLEEEIIDDLNITNNEQMPVMINVLSIITFIYSGSMILMSIYYLLTIEKRTEEFYQAMEVLDSSDMPDNPLIGAISDIGSLAIDNAPFLYSFEILVAILSIIGAIMMRKLMISGFYTYIFATLVYIGSAAYIFGFGFGIMTYILVSVLFPILYGVNVKHLK